MDVPWPAPIPEQSTTQSWEGPVVLDEPDPSSHDLAGVAEELSHDESAGTHDRSDAAGTLDVPLHTSVDESWESPIVLEEDSTGPWEAEPSSLVPDDLQPATAGIAAEPEPSEELSAETDPGDPLDESEQAATTDEESADVPLKPEVPAAEAPVPTDASALRRAAIEAQSRGEFDRAEACLRKLVTNDPSDVADWDALAQLYLERQLDEEALECLVALRRIVPALSRERLLADERMAGILNRMNRPAEGLACLESACEIADRRHRDDAETAESLSDLSRTLIEVARAQISGSDPNKNLTQAVASALPRLVRCLTVRERIVSRFGTSASAVRDVVDVLVMVADTEFDLGNWHVAFARYSRAIELQRKLIEEHGTSPAALDDLCRLLECAGSIRRFGGDLLGAATSYQSSLEIRLDLLNQSPSEPAPVREAAAVLEKLGDIARSCGNLREAAMHFRRALEYRERVLREFGESVEALTELADLEWRLSQTVPEEATAHLERGRAAIQSILDHNWGDPATQAQLSRFERQLNSSAS
jgi:tetratricopeptide (TPR) repeat protein